MISDRWKTIAEFAGITGIILSLVFVGVQLRQEHRVANAERGMNIAQSYYEELNGRIENAEVWVKGNAGVDELSPTESVIYDALIRKRFTFAFWGTYASRQLGVTRDVGIHDFAAFLHENPGARRTWIAWMTTEQDYREKLISEPVGVEIVNIVLADLEKLDQLDGR
jgi:uncharacterized membrane protein YecN with MAPEG domain